MEKPDLILLCDNYPLSNGEFFLDDELRIIHPYFSKIIILIKKQNISDLERFIPSNLDVFTYDDNVKIKDILRAFLKVISNLFVNELLNSVFKFKLKELYLIIKIMFMDLVKSGIILKELECHNLLIESGNKKIFYSYWHDYKALAIARISKKKHVISIGRAHGWDVFSERHSLPYLPFKPFILENLTCTYSISKIGRLELLKYNRNEEKIKVFNLGKLNNRIALNEKNTNGFLICSCSNIVPLKRVDKIIDLLADLSILDIKWIHFGDGNLRKEMQELADNKLTKGSFEFKGVVPNSKILDFYAQTHVDLFINLSETEGIPVSIMEAFSAGIPVVATDVGGTREAVNSDNGFLVKKDFDINELADIIKGYLNSPLENQQKYRINAYQFWKDNFDAEKNYNEFAEEILMLVKV